MIKSILNPYYPLSVTDSKNYLILFILWPFLALITAMVNYSQKEARKVVYIFLVYYGLTFFIDFEHYYDAVGYAIRLQENATLPFSDFFKIVGGLYTSDTSVDIVEPFISFVVSRFTSQHNLLFGIYAAVFGFFYLKSINLLHDRYRLKPGWNAVIFLSFFVLIMPITNISGFRYYTASWIFFYGAYHVILNRDARYLLIALASSLVHFSFLSANLVLIIYYFAGNRNFIYLPLALSSFVLPQLMAPLFKSVALRLGGPLQTRYEGYTNETYISEIQGSYENASWFLTLSQDLVFYYLIFVIIFIQIKSRNLLKEDHERNLFSFLLLFLSFVNFGMVVPSLGGRFQTVFYLFVTLYVFLFYIKQPGNKISLLPLIGLFPMLLNAAVTFRLGSESINAWIFTPGLGLPLIVPGLSLSDFLFH